MKITDVTVTVWQWNDIPPTRYTKLVSSSKKRSTQMGLVKISTEDGIDGYSFFGSSLSTAKHDAPYIIRALKPILMGKHALDRERIFQTLTRAHPQAINKELFPWLTTLYPIWARSVTPDAFRLATRLALTELIRLTRPPPA